MTSQEFIKKPSKLSAIAGMIFVLSSILTFVFFATPLRAEMNSSKINYEMKLKNFQDLSSKLIQLQTDSEQFSFMGEVERQTLKNSVPFELNQDGIIRDLVKISSENGITLTSISFGLGATNLPEIKSLRVNAGFSGSFADLIKFLRGIEGNARLINVNSISVQVSTEVIGGVKRANFSLSMETYYQ